MSDGRLRLRYVLTGDLAGITFPLPAPRVHTDGLWQHTCCEAFLRVGDEPAYREFNFAPSGAWAAYGFETYRTGGVFTLADCHGIDVMHAPPSPRSAAQMILEARLPALAIPSGPSLRMALTAVIEAADGSISYWSLRHPPGKPDFHHPDNFVPFTATEAAP